MLEYFETPTTKSPPKKILEPNKLHKISKTFKVYFGGNKVCFWDMAFTFEKILDNAWNFNILFLSDLGVSDSLGRGVR